MFKIIVTLAMVFVFCGCTQNGTDFKNTDGGLQGKKSPEPVNGVCGAKDNICTSGVSVDVVDSDTQFLWACRGDNGGRNVSCKLDKPVPPTNAACGTTNNSCISGTLVDIADSATQYLWTCTGTNAGNNASCSLNLPPPPPEPIDPNCVQVFYDTSVDTFKLGRTYSLMLINLLGHFPEYQQVIGPVELYRKGDIDRCHATFYLGSEFDNKLPADFLSDFKTTTKQVVWMGYNFWQLGTDFETEFGYSATDYEHTTIDYTKKTPAPESIPGFYRDILYKGEIWPKQAEWDPANPAVLEAPFEMAKLKTKLSAVAVVLGEAKHNITNEVIPWALQSKSKNRFFITELPFGYMHEGDRYFVFADLLFDFLKVQPKHNAKNAVLRLEDIHAMYELNFLDEAIAILKKYQIKPHISLIPIFNDPFFVAGGTAAKPMVRIEEEPTFAAALKKYKTDGTGIIWHGVTHQYNSLKNPFTGASGDDYEFWNWITNSPVAEDNITYVLDKMDDGFNSLKQFDIAPKCWVTPHYHGSALDQVLFGHMFDWMIGRNVYSDPKITGLKTLDASKPLNFDLNNAATTQNRKDFFSGLQVATDPNFTQFGQLFSYEIYGDIYSARLLPENLGNVQPYLSDQVKIIRNVDKMLVNAKRNLVLRDVWASMFYHPFMLDGTLNVENADATKPKDLERLVSGIQALGYKFINLDEYADANKTTRGKPRIELTEIRK